MSEPESCGERSLLKVLDEKIRDLVECIEHEVSDLNDLQMQVACVESLIGARHVLVESYAVEKKIDGATKLAESLEKLAENAGPFIRSAIEQAVAKASSC